MIELYRRDLGAGSQVDASDLFRMWRDSYLCHVLRAPNGAVLRRSTGRWRHEKWSVKGFHWKECDD